MKSTYQYRERDYTFGNLYVTLRTAIGVTQGEIVRLFGSPTALSRPGRQL